MDEQQSASKRLKSKGYKITKPRRDLLDILEKNPGKAYSVQELYEVLKEKGVNFSTVYRNLEVMANEGIISAMHRENGIQSYALCCHHHHHHLICTECGNTQCIDFCPMPFIDKTLWGGFTPVKHRFEIMGICSKCSAEVSV